MHLLALPILHPIFCIFLLTLSNLIPYNNFFQAIADSHSMGLFQTLLSTMLLHALHDLSLITAKAFFHQFIIYAFPQRKKREMGLRRQNFQFIQNCGRILASLLKKLLGAVLPLLTTTFLTVAFFVVITRLLVHNARAIEPIGVIGTLERLSVEVIFYLFYFILFLFSVINYYYYFFFGFFFGFFLGGDHMFFDNHLCCKFLLFIFIFSFFFFIFLIFFYYYYIFYFFLTPV